MTLVLILSSLGAGGAERVIAQLANHWVASGKAVVVIAFDQVSDPVFHHFDDRVRLVRLGLPPEGGALYSALRRTIRRIVKLRQTLRDMQPTVIISFLLKINVTTLIAAAGLNVPVVVSERNHPVRGTGNRIWRWARTGLYSRAASVVLQTEASRAVLSPAIVRRSVVIPNPITAWPRAPEPLTNRALVAVGRLDQQKGFDLLLQAFATVAQRHPDWRLVIWGEGPCRAQLEAQRTALALDDRVSLPGVSATPGGWIKSTSVFVLSSRFEGFGNAVAEALAAGLPIVAFSCEFGIHEMLNGGTDGLLVPPEDIGALARAMERIITDHQLRGMLARRAKKSAVRFAPVTVFGAWDRLLTDIVHPKNDNIATDTLLLHSGYLINHK